MVNIASIYSFCVAIRSGVLWWDEFSLDLLFVGFDFRSWARRRVSFLQFGELELQRTIRTLELCLELYPQPCHTYPPSHLQISFGAVERWAVGRLRTAVVLEVALLRNAPQLVLFGRCPGADSAVCHHLLLIHGPGQINASKDLKAIE